MEVDPIPPSTAPDQPSIDVAPTPVVSAPSKAPPARKPRASYPAPASRSLRARPSDTGQPGPATPSNASGLRRPTPKDLEYIQKRLGPEALIEKRDEVVRRKEEELKGVMDGHDTDVRERFHLERFISILEGYDPVVS